MLDTDEETLVIWAVCWLQLLLGEGDLLSADIPVRDWGKENACNQNMK